ncbi:isopentenyl-diphosphate Delta-isomerase [Serratia entomophila]|uniref:isopentenyl-diphosphate Delta-isomerase n=1 Tax=Serratia entomophila TaxID=42906 RepID=UPI002179C6EE|nr:isopentenyl-diphosphate Delta-isomerase [Serratia entomophila]CAI0759506.1 Isopentenyl-diphosphate Delta-isomerase [Serratia entomophila]CAI0820280.1 Isopentenyl-diphosphate Delta-isomerase [Serratia entomophila]CAI0821205.1 Isopentenyl-diphosphate Delta-isomerase [Serratia entomophila]CAI0822223.1 Isopentenyl-diphosphate Delta-isomerase [Serratia entomophila]CAI1572026.1 Isopentenyl-diphosphate Delta-isomerase [Serratia entomophila]
MEEILILVDNEDNSIGAQEKLFVHQQGLLHRAFSIFIFDSKGRLLLQQRAHGKYHSAGLWTNSCCGHPRWGEDTEAAACRRLKEEMGFSARLKKVSSFTYHAEVPGNLIEHELDHIYVGLFDGYPSVDPDEAADWLWIDIPQLIHKVKTQPECFTVWFGIIMNKVGANELEGWERIALRE